MIPLRISHVCQYWRDTAISLGELWSYLSIQHSREGVRSIQWWGSRTAMLNIFDTWLRRTGKGPINFTLICFLTRSPKEDHRACEHIITTLIAQQQRWKDVRLTWKGFQPSPDLQAIEITNMPLLTSLLLRPVLGSVQGIDSPRIPFRIDISHSRRLRRLIVESVDSLEVGHESFDEMIGLSIDTAKGGTSLADRIWTLL